MVVGTLQQLHVCYCRDKGSYLIAIIQIQLGLTAQYVKFIGNSFPSNYILQPFKM